MVYPCLLAYDTRARLAYCRVGFRNQSVRHFGTSRTASLSCSKRILTPEFLNMKPHHNKLVICEKTNLCPNDLLMLYALNRLCMLMDPKTLVYFATAM